MRKVWNNANSKTKSTRITHVFYARSSGTNTGTKCDLTVFVMFVRSLVITAWRGPPVADGGDGLQIWSSVVLSPLANRSSDRRRSAKLVPTIADRGCHVVSATSPSDRNFDFLDLEPLLFLPSSSSNCSRGWVDPVPDPLLLRKIWQRWESNPGPLC
jgi:hypothetical protein